MSKLKYVIVFQLIIFIMYGCDKDKNPTSPNVKIKEVSESISVIEADGDRIWVGLDFELVATTVVAKHGRYSSNVKHCLEGEFMRLMSMKILSR